MQEGGRYRRMLRRRQRGQEGAELDRHEGHQGHVQGYLELAEKEPERFPENLIKFFFTSLKFYVMTKLFKITKKFL